MDSFEEDLGILASAGPVKVNKEEVEICLMGVSYPKTKRELVAHAINNRCDSSVIESIERALKHDYSNLEELEKEIAA